jgi:predicted AAA+ superfamily ATPase
MRKKRVLIMYGPRRTGKTTLLQSYLKNCGKRYLLENGENIQFSELLSSHDLSRIRTALEGYELLAIDEAQAIPGIGLSLKLIIDHIPECSVIVTGSSSFSLSQQTGEPLTGRKRTITLFPLAQLELKHHLTNYELQHKLEDFLIFGSYPEVVSAQTKGQKIEILQELVNSYLLKDILTYDNLRSSRSLVQLLKLLAFQVGSEVSLNELSRRLKIDVKTVARYIDLLEKTFVIRAVTGFSRNLRKEVTSKAKYYFLDTGIRNGIISQFGPLETRDDQGALFENFLIAERLKKQEYTAFYGNMHFWRTYDQQEIDLVEVIDGNIDAFEFKWGKKRPKAPKAFREAYQQATYSVISKDNYLDFVL